MSLAVSPPARSRADRMGDLLGWAASAAFAAATVLLVLLHLVPAWGGNLDPVTAMLSEYAWTPGAPLWDSALVLAGTGSLVLLIPLWRKGILRGEGTVTAFVLWCVSILAVAAFTKDPQGGAVTFTGKLHLYATGIACAALPATGFGLARRHRAGTRFAVLTGTLALAALPLFLPFIVPFAVNVLAGAPVFPTVATGLFERLLGVLELALLFVLAAWSRRRPG